METNCAILTMSNMLSGLMEKVHNIQEQMDSVNSNRNSKKEANRNIGNQKH